jgi:hypothetical protein
LPPIFAFACALEASQSFSLVLVMTVALSYWQ